MIRPRNDQILVRLDPAHSEYDGPLVMPGNLDPDKAETRAGTVLAVGPGDHGRSATREDGLAKERIPIPIEVGDRVLVEQIQTNGWWQLVDEEGGGTYMIAWRDVLAVCHPVEHTPEGYVRAGEGKTV
jgi:co-chaperonin GroES (HSP10)